MDIFIIFKSLNHLALFLLTLYAIICICVLAYIIRRYQSKHNWDKSDSESAPVVSKKFENAHWFGSIEGFRSSSARDEPDNQSILTVTTISDVYKDYRLSVDLNERVFYKEHFQSFCAQVQSKK
ncbi:hypothetical protein HDE_07229 [Halotydeus destructor]|nr:hypothetical protein HDE_07229 [Halotydeus destructor]